MYKTKPYHNEDFEEVLLNPSKADEEAKMFGQSCMPVGINGTFMPIKKDDPSNFKKAQYNIRERFGLLQDEDYNNENETY